MFFVFNTCVRHSDGLVELQGIEYPFSPARFFSKNFPCLTVWPFWLCDLLEVFPMFQCYHQCGLKYVFVCKMFQFLFIILCMLRSVLLYVIVIGILFLLFFSLHVNSSFLSILSTFLICSSRTSSLCCWSRNFCLMTTQFLLNFVLAEQIVFSFKAWLYGMLLFRDIGCSDLACKNAC